MYNVFIFNFFLLLYIERFFFILFILSYVLIFSLIKIIIFSKCRYHFLCKRYIRISISCFIPYFSLNETKFFLSILWKTAFRKVNSRTLKTRVSPRLQPEIPASAHDVSPLLERSVVARSDKCFPGTVDAAWNYYGAKERMHYPFCRSFHDFNDFN